DRLDPDITIRRSPLNRASSNPALPVEVGRLHHAGARGSRRIARNAAKACRPCCPAAPLAENVTALASAINPPRGRAEHVWDGRFSAARDLIYGGTLCPLWVPWRLQHA